MILCFDIGGTAIKYGIATEVNGQIVFSPRWETATNAKNLKGKGVKLKVLQLISELKDEYNFTGIAVSTAGIVDPQSGLILYANENIPGYAGQNLKIAVEDAFHLPCWVENDVMCAALGESTYGAGFGASSVFCMTVGTGIGGALIQNGKIWHGSGMSAGEIGYMPMNNGLFEDQASVSALIRKVYQQTGESLDGREIISRAKNGDAICADQLDRMCGNLALGIVICMCVVNPQVVVLGGGIMKQETYLRPLIIRHLKHLANPYMMKNTTFKFATLGNNAGMAGAYRWFEQQTTISNRVSNPKEGEGLH